MRIIWPFSARLGWHWPGNPLCGSTGFVVILPITCADTIPFIPLHPFLPSIGTRSGLHFYSEYLFRKASISYQTFILNWICGVPSLSIKHCYGPVSLSLWRVFTDSHGGLWVSFKQDLRHAFSGWKLTNPRLQSVYLCSVVNMDALDQGLRILDQTEVQYHGFLNKRTSGADVLWLSTVLVPCCSHWGRNSSIFVTKK